MWCMRNAKIPNYSHLEEAVKSILKSRAESRIYLFLLRKHGAKTEDIIKGTKLHPSTVRETLIKMLDKNIIERTKVKNDNIGKNPYRYYPLSPTHLLRQYVTEIEEMFNYIAFLSNVKTTGNPEYKPVTIKICESAER